MNSIISKIKTTTYNWSKRLVILLVLAIPSQSFAHGMVSTTAAITQRTNKILEIQVQFDLLALLNTDKRQYSLAQLAALDDKQFELLFKEVKKLFDKKLTVHDSKRKLALHSRYPSAKQVKKLVMQQYAEQSVARTYVQPPYTYSDRRFFQKFFFDLRLANAADIQSLVVNFPYELKHVVVTFNKPQTKEVHQGSAWRLGSDESAASMKHTNRHNP